MCKSLEEMVDSGKTRQQELAKEVAALGADLTQAREQIASQEFILVEKDLNLTNKDNELAIWVVEITQKQQELDWESKERDKA